MFYFACNHYFRTARDSANRCKIERHFYFRVIAALGGVQTVRVLLRLYEYIIIALALLLLD